MVGMMMMTMKMTPLMLVMMMMRHATSEWQQVQALQQQSLPTKLPLSLNRLVLLSLMLLAAEKNKNSILKYVCLQAHLQEAPTDVQKIST